jgi:glycosyltransferase involved in cell wall biosynthesis
MKILHLRASNFYGGPERQIHFHARLARQAGYQIIIGSFSEQGHGPEFLNIIAADNIDTHLFQVQSAYDFSAIGKLREYLKKNNIRILCTHDYRSHFIGFRATRDIRTGWAAFSRGWTKDTLRVRLYTLLEKSIIRFADHIVAVSGSQKRKLTKLFIPDTKITVAHNAVDYDFFKNVEPNDLRRQFNFPTDSIIVIAAGRFSREKGQRYLIKAAAAAIMKNRNLRFIIYGDGPDFDYIVSMIKKLDHEQYIKCPGFEKNLLKSLKGSDILVNPSLSEGLPNIVLEAMALGVPVIATAVGGVPELINNDINGILIPSSNSDAMASAIVRLAADLDRRNRLAGEGKSTITKEFTFEEQFAALNTVYRQFERKNAQDKNS